MQWKNTGWKLPEKISDYTTACWDGKLYVIGGLKDVSVTNERSNRTYILDLQTGVWSRGQDFPAYIHGATAIATEYGIYLIGGATGAEAIGFEAVNYEMYRYDGLMNTWSYTGINIPVNWDMGLCLYGEYVYVLGGVRNVADYRQDIYRFPVKSPTGFAQLSAVLPESFTRVTSQAYDGKIYTICDREMAVLDLETMEMKSGSGPINLMSSPVSTIHMGEIWVSFLWGEVNVYNVEDNRWRAEITSPAYVTGMEAWNSTLYMLPYVAREQTDDSIYSYDMRSIRIVNPAPSAGFINEKVDNTFTWGITSIPPTRQNAATFQWREGSGGTVHSRFVTGETTAITVPANTFPDGSIQWRVKVTGDNGVESEFTPWLSLTTVDEKPMKPTGLYPNSGVWDGSKAIELFWIHNSPLGTPQSAYELEVTYDSGASYSHLSGPATTEATMHVVTAGTFTPGPGGTIGWRVRTYNSDGVSGEWSDTAYFTVITAPDAPVIRSVEQGKSRPRVEWVPFDQQVWQLQVRRGDETIYDTIPQYGTKTDHKVEEYLPNGSYTFAVRTQNAFGLWSEWGTYQAAVSTVATMKITLTGEAIENGAHLEFFAEEVT